MCLHATCLMQLEALSRPYSLIEWIVKSGMEGSENSKKSSTIMPAPSEDLMKDGSPSMWPNVTCSVVKSRASNVVTSNGSLLNAAFACRSVKCAENARPISSIIVMKNTQPGCLGVYELALASVFVLLRFELPSSRVLECGSGYF
ncbi:hypothetical protein AG1IA_10144 [Rhizoctonia solani AG-1 IA]|uniref:Uncharacterized protein n=1 Tax=Thanatephorus cucumeris (strain AG1-IA) TaxID=983506 RepID=L8WCE3_THACA|nr:hypothetical protein AG1IA_10144 [Rhizoctonia solani AG-1 IA]